MNGPRIAPPEDTEAANELDRLIAEEQHDLDFEDEEDDYDEQ